MEEFMQAYKHYMLTLIDPRDYEPLEYATIVEGIDGIIKELTPQFELQCEIVALMLKKKVGRNDSPNLPN